MGAARRSGWRALLDWMRVVLPPWWAVALFLFGLAGFEALTHSLLAPFELLDSEQVRKTLVLAHAPRDTWLGFALIAYGAYRVMAMHPYYRPAYARWLSQTPWDGRLPLPLGPVHLVLQDAVVFLFVWLVSLHASALDVRALLTLLLFPYLLAVIFPLRVMQATAHAYLIAFGLAVVVWLRIPSTASTVVLVTLYGVAWRGLPRSLSGFAWNVSPRLYAYLQPRMTFTLRKEPSTTGQPPVAFPFTQLSPRPDFMAISLCEALLVSALAGCWMFAVTSLVSDSSERASICVVLSTWGIGGAAFARVFIYFLEYRPPISLWGRIATRRWIIPGFDVALVPFAAAALVVAAMIAASRWFSPVYTGPVALAAGWSILLGMPPTLRDWALAGNHRIVGAARRGEFIEI